MRKSNQKTHPPTHPPKRTDGRTKGKTYVVDAVGKQVGDLEPAELKVMRPRVVLSVHLGVSDATQHTDA